MQLLPGINFYQKFKNKGKQYTVQHFLAQGVPKSTIYSVINRVDSGQSYKRKEGTGAERKLTKPQEKDVKRLMENKKGVSTKTLGKKFGVSRFTIARTFKRQGGKYHLRRRAPLVTEKQRPKIMEACEALATIYYPLNSSTAIVIDDESYFPVGNDSLSGNRGFWSTDPKAAPDDVRFRKETKFPMKILASVVISERGFSEPYFTPAKQVIEIQLKLFLPFFAIFFSMTAV